MDENVAMFAKKCAQNKFITKANERISNKTDLML